jgi:hypothetical protein
VPRDYFRHWPWIVALFAGIVIGSAVLGVLIAWGRGELAWP